MHQEPFRRRDNEYDKCIQKWLWSAQAHQICLRISSCYFSTSHQDAGPPVVGLTFPHLKNQSSTHPKISFFLLRSPPLSLHLLFLLLPPHPLSPGPSTPSNASSEQSCCFACILPLCLYFPASSAWAPGPVSSLTARYPSAQGGLQAEGIAKTLLRKLSSLMLFLSWWTQGHWYYPSETSSKKGTDTSHSKSYYFSPTTVV